MRVRPVFFFAAVVAGGVIGLLFPGIPGDPSWASSDRTLPSLSVFQSSPPEIGIPLPDRDIRLRGTGIGVYPIQLLPGVIFDETGPVKLWDEVSVDTVLGTVSPGPGRRSGR